jgi:hypothetical protein
MRDLIRLLARTIVLAALAACTAAPAMAQYAIPWFTIDGGGAMQVSGGAYGLGSTIGQPDAGTLLAGGSYSLSGGFWVGGNSVTGIGDGDDQADELPLAFRLHPMSPNPVVHHATVRFDLPQARVVRLGIYDAAGRVVKTLAEGPLPAGRFRRAWDGTDQGGRRVAAGIYFLRFDAETVQSWQKVVVLK